MPDLSYRLRSKIIIHLFFIGNFLIKNVFLMKLKTSDNREQFRL